MIEYGKYVSLRVLGADKAVQILSKKGDEDMGPRAERGLADEVADILQYWGLELADIHGRELTRDQLDQMVGVEALGIRTPLAPPLSFFRLLNLLPTDHFVGILWFRNVLPGIWTTPRGTQTQKWILEAVKDQYLPALRELAQYIERRYLIQVDLGIVGGIPA